MMDNNVNSLGTNPFYLKHNLSNTGHDGMNDDANELLKGSSAQSRFHYPNSL